MTGSAYARLETRFRRFGRLRDIRGLLAWDQRVMMPPGTSALRADHLAELEVMAQEILQAPDLPDLLANAEAEAGRAGGADPWRDANLREMRRAWQQANAVPADLLVARARAQAAGEMAWRGARAENRFADFVAPLQAVIAVTRDWGDALAAPLGCDRYDALLDQYEPGASRAAIAPLFADLAAFIPEVLPRILERQAAAPPPHPQAEVAVDRQAVAGRGLAAFLGFDFDRGRLDESLHPFTSGAGGDTRITTRYLAANPLSGLLAVAHETGHALYEDGLPAAWRVQPVGRARGMVLHESQSLLCERQVMRAPRTLDWLAGHLAATFGADPAWEAANLYRLATRVRPSLIRVEADEVTYPLHILLRTELEQALLSGDLPAGDLPAAWAERMQALLGIAVPSDRDGCLQDIHWSTGSFGYFPTYTLGALAGAQLHEAALRDLGADAGHRAVLGWMREKVHRAASSGTTDAILLAATGAPLGTAAFERHIRASYLS
ncbi:MAG: carboxypeptidase M32 [Sneathiellaceae bacterium]